VAHRAAFHDVRAWQRGLSGGPVRAGAVRAQSSDYGGEFDNAYSDTPLVGWHETTPGHNRRHTIPYVLGDLEQRGRRHRHRRAALPVGRTTDIE